MELEDVITFNELSRKLCDELKSKDKCMFCPFFQWDTYFECFDEHGDDFPLEFDDYV